MSRPSKHLVEERVHRAEHALVGEVLGAPGLHQRLEVDRPDEVGLHRALGELAREDARLPGALVDDAPEHGRGEPLFAVPGGPVISTCSRAEQRERDLREDVLALTERTCGLAP